MYPPPAGNFAANGTASPPTAWPAATHLPAWKKLLMRIGGQSFGDLGKVVAVMMPSGEVGQNRENSGKVGNALIISGIVAIDSLTENIRKDIKHDGPSLQESSGKIGSARIALGIVVIDSLHPKI
ncbi:hypothetical protein NQ317_010078 [Molorchus minor]|uniref:Uncharacterized protein n=1 Tax=Molorchus minor TaxID=1323400 RepID=A0ABQ9J3F7_9CUCU|nr:hypothetical protein NQ317_010078 [Molorchus minor]